MRFGILTSMRRLFVVVLVTALASHAALRSQANDSVKPSAPQEKSARTDPIVTGRVVDEEGKPIEGAAVGVFEREDLRWRCDTASFLRKAKVRTDETGRFSISVRGAGSSSSLMIASRRRQAGVRRIAYALRRVGGSIGDTVLVPGSRVVGRVRDARGMPIAGARVVVESSIEEHQSYLAHPYAGAVSNAKGRFVVPCVPRRGIRVTAIARGYSSASKLVVDQSPSFVLTKTGFVRGRVVDANGKPMKDVKVVASTVEKLGRSNETRSDANGEFALTVPKQGRFAVHAHEGRPPHRSFRGVLCHGPVDGVVIRPIEAAKGDRRRLTVKARSRKGRKPIPRFWLSTHERRAPAQILLFHHSLGKEEHEGRADLVLWPGPDPIGTVVVEAAGFGFEIVDVPSEGAELLVDLGPEALLTGRVIDAETGRPRAGVAVRALPVGTGSGRGGHPEDAGPLTDADGRYTITGLRPGEYTVQTHLAGRPPSRPTRVELRSDRTSKLDLRVPKALWLELAIEGTVPEQPRFTLRIGAARSSSGERAGSFGHFASRIQAPLLTGPGKYRLGPISALAEYEVVLERPSRVRFGTGPRISLGFFDPSRGLKRIAVPDLTSTLVHGRVVLPREVPAERVAVIATRAPSGGRRVFGRHPKPNIAGISSDGDFTFDLPGGRYVIQAIDLLTGIVFHTRESDYDTRYDGELTLRPTIRWLEIECRPKKAGDPVVLHTFLVKAQRQRRDVPAVLKAWGGDNETQTGNVPYRLGATTQRWLLPDKEIRITAHQTFGMLRPASQGWRSQDIGVHRIDKPKAQQRIVFDVPAPPSDAELLRQSK